MAAHPPEVEARPRRGAATGRRRQVHTPEGLPVNSIHTPITTQQQVAAQTLPSTVAGLYQPSEEAEEEEEILPRKFGIEIFC